MIEALTIEEYALQEVAAGAPICCHDGVWWNRVRKFFYQPVHVFQHVEVDSRPPLDHIIGGYRVLASSGEEANCRIRAMLMEGSEVGEYSVHSVDTKRRNLIRKSLQTLEVRDSVTRNDFLGDGFDVIRSFRDRTRWGKEWTADSWAKWTESACSQPKRITLGAYYNDKMVGFVRGFVLEETAYISFIATHSEYLKFYPNEALIFSFIEKVKEAGVERLMFGIASRKESLDRFKLSMGFRITPVPGRLRLNTCTGLIMKIALRSQYDRIIGD